MDNLRPIPPPIVIGAPLPNIISVLNSIGIEINEEYCTVLYKTTEPSQLVLLEKGQSYEPNKVS